MTTLYVQGNLEIIGKSLACRCSIGIYIILNEHSVSLGVIGQLYYIQAFFQ